MDKNTKLTDVQKRVIKRMQAGEKIFHISGYNAKCFFQPNENLSWATVLKLEKCGLIYRTAKCILLTKHGGEIKI